MRVIRRGCFETNSSSLHSIVVTKNDVHVSTNELSDWGDEHVYLSHEGKLWFWSIDDGYGRSPFAVLRTFREKLQYAMCAYLGYKYSDDPEYNEIYSHFENIVKNLLPNFTGFDISETEMDIYRDENGNLIMRKNLMYDGWDSENNCAHYIYRDENGESHDAILDESEVLVNPDIGMIDHQSANTLIDFLDSHNVSLEEFLTNKKYIVVVDGDEYCIWLEMKEAGLINMDNIVEEYH